MKNFLSFWLAYFRMAIVQPLPAGIIPDPAANFGLTALLGNMVKYAAREIAAVTTAGTASVLTAAQAHRSVIRLDTGASGGFTLTLPATTAIISALGPSIPTDGTFSKRVRIVNNNVGQTGTLTAGDASTTITGTATIATNTAREFLLTVLSPTTLSYENLGSATL